MVVPFMKCCTGLKRHKEAMCLVTAIILTTLIPVRAKEFLAADSSQLRAAISKLKPGDTLLIAPGNYAGDSPKDERLKKIGAHAYTRPK